MPVLPLAARQAGQKLRNALGLRCMLQLLVEGRRGDRPLAQLVAVCELREPTTAAHGESEAIGRSVQGNTNQL